MLVQETKAAAVVNVIAAWNCFSLGLFYTFLAVLGKAKVEEGCCGF